MVQAILYVLLGIAGCTVVVRHIIIRVQICIGNDLAGTGGMDKLSAANIDTDVGETCLVCILEEHQVTGLQIGLGNGCALSVHGGLCTADIDAVTAEHIVDETGAVKTAGICAAPLVGNT